MKYIQRLIFLAALFSPPVIAEDAVEARIRAGLQQLAPSMEVDTIRKAPINGIYQAMIGPEVLYVSEDGRYVFYGELFEVESRRNLTKEDQSVARREILKGINKEDYIEFAPKKAMHIVYVFTDIDCGYCRKLHRDVPELNKKGIAVRYLAFPRAGLDSGTGKEMQAVWCADDRQQAITNAKNSRPFAVQKCDQSIAGQYELGKLLGVKGTPAIYLENGASFPGYLKPQKLLDYISRAQKRPHY